MDGSWGTEALRWYPYAATISVSQFPNHMIIWYSYFIYVLITIRIFFTWHSKTYRDILVELDSIGSLL